MTEKDWNQPFQACPCCASTDFNFSFVMTYWRDYPLRFHDCKNCEASFANPMPSDDLITRGNNALVSLAHQNRTFESEFKDARQAYLRGRIFAEELKKIKESGRLLEVGCYDGFFLAGVRDHSQWQVEGVEIATEVAKFAGEKLGLTVHQGTLESLGQLKTYDFIRCHDLIEHINDPSQFFKKISDLLKSNGRIEVITPNAFQDLAFARRAFESKKTLNMVLNHVIYYSPLSIKKAFERVGVNIEEIYCYDIRHTPKDLNWLGLGENLNLPIPQGMPTTLDTKNISKKHEWTSDELSQLRTHFKTSKFYGWIKEIIPKALQIKVSPRFKIGHEIFARGIKN